jgi:cytidine deaminase
MKELARGMNHYLPSYHNSIHAEVAAINNLHKTKKKIKIDIIVIRINKSGNLCNSEPCLSCLKYMEKHLLDRNYILKNIYYSDNNSNIVKTKLNI